MVNGFVLFASTTSHLQEENIQTTKVNNKAEILSEKSVLHEHQTHFTTKAECQWQNARLCLLSM